MANHGFVKAGKGKKVTSQLVDECLVELNTRLWRSMAVISKSDDCWTIVFHEKNIAIVCWIEGGRFAIRHGGNGGSFRWWVDFSITNEIAIACGGKVLDEGIGPRDHIEVSPGRFDDEAKFLKTFMMGDNAQVNQWYLKTGVESFPWPVSVE